MTLKERTSVPDWVSEGDECVFTCLPVVDNLFDYFISSFFSNHRRIIWSSLFLNFILAEISQGIEK